MFSLAIIKIILDWNLSLILHVMYVYRYHANVVCFALCACETMTFAPCERRSFASLSNLRIFFRRANTITSIFR